MNIQVISCCHEIAPFEREVPPGGLMEVLLSFRQYEIVLRPEGVLTGWLGRLLHGALFARLAQGRPDLGTVLHAQNRKPFSLWYRQREGLLFWHLSTWDDALAVAIPELFAAGTVLRLSQTDAQVLSFAPRGALRLEQSASPLTCCRLRFITPTCFRSDGQPLLFPESRLLLESAARATGLPCPAQPEQALRPLCYALQTRDISFGPFVLTGFTGWCEYRVENSPETQALLRVLPYTGAGYKTAQGMGSVRVTRCK